MLLMATLVVTTLANGNVQSFKAPDYETCTAWRITVQRATPGVIALCTLDGISGSAPRGVGSYDGEAGGGEIGATQTGRAVVDAVKIWGGHYSAHRR